MTTLTPARAALALVGLTLGVTGVLALREATLSTHEPVAGRETELVVSARTEGGEQGQTLAEMVEAQLLTCRLEVNSDLAGTDRVTGRRALPHRPRAGDGPDQPPAIPRLHRGLRDRPPPNRRRAPDISRLVVST